MQLFQSRRRRLRLVVPVAVVVFASFPNVKGGFAAQEAVPEDEAAATGGARPLPSRASPRYKGRALAEWVADLADRDAATASLAIQAIAVIGAPARGELLAALESIDPVARQNAIVAIHGIEAVWWDACKGLIEAAEGTKPSMSARPRWRSSAARRHECSSAGALARSGDANVKATRGHQHQHHHTSRLACSTPPRRPAPPRPRDRAHPR